MWPWKKPKFNLLSLAMTVDNAEITTTAKGEDSWNEGFIEEGD